jgi:FkbM family methyltransferase
MKNKSQSSLSRTALTILKKPLRPAWRRFKLWLRARNPRAAHNAAWLAQLQKLRSGAEISTVLDVGANRGQTSEEFLRLLPGARVFAVEPIPQAAADIAARCGDNPLLSVAVMALDEHDGEREFRINAHNQTSSFLQTFAGAKDEAYMGLERVAKVPIMTLGSFCRSRGIQTLDILKMDIQGNELPVVRGGSDFLPNVAAIYAEVLFGRYYVGQTEFAELDTFLRGHGFWLFDIYHQHRAPDGQLMCADALWLNKKFYPETDAH